MAIDLYGLDEEKYIELFRENSRLMFRTMTALVQASRQEKVDINGWPQDVFWKMYESMCYDTSEQARQIQKEKDPELLKNRGYEPIVYASNSDIMNELKQIKEQLKPHVE